MVKGYEVVIGLETHAELNTESKIYCDCKNQFGLEVNSQVCPICMGMPGTLPTLNEKVVDYAIRMGHALNCEINRVCKQDRKNYFYPDLPKAYQISQAEDPLCGKGYVDILVDSEEKANELLQQYNDGEQTEDAFAALAVANSTDSNASSGGLYTDIYRGQTVSEFEDWCFDPSRQAGDTGIVQTSYGYHVMYFVSTNENPYWYVQAETSLKSSAYNEWYAAITDGVEAEQLSGMKYVG